jgi:Flp pilus assembly protein TadG
MTAATRVRRRSGVGWRGRIRARFIPDGSERGAVLVEAAFVFPVFILLLFGMIEFGFVFKDSLTLSSMVQAGVRTGAEAGNSTGPSADYEILSALEAADNSLGSTINYVIIFRADGTDSTLPANCNITNGSVANECNVYPASFFQTPLPATEPTGSGGFDCNLNSGPPTDPTETWGNTSGCMDSAWPPSERNVTESNGGPDYLGVYINASHKTITGFFPSVTLSDTAIMRLEPQAFNSSI